MARSRQDLRVVVIEEHTEALESLALAARRHFFPLNHVCFVHFDSHPDLSCPDSSIQPHHLRNRAELCHKLRNSCTGISTFILPAIALNLITDVIWVKPPWSNQIPSGYYANMKFGWKKTAVKGIDSNVASVKDIACIVGDDGLEKKRKWTENKDSHVMQLCMVTSLSYWVEDNAAVKVEAELEDFWTFNLTVIDEVSSLRVGSVVEKISSADKEESTPETLWVLDVCLDFFSCANPLQDPNLPEHISSTEEIAAMLKEFNKSLRRLQRTPPALCIIARSEEDGFTPQHAIDVDLENSVIKIIEEAFGSIRVHRIQNIQSFYDAPFIRQF